MFNYLFVVFGMAVFAMSWGAFHHESTELTVVRAVVAVAIGVLIRFLHLAYLARRQSQK